jgi:prepilin-type N-terminal cleavage/methylation domain-containing protein
MTQPITSNGRQAGFSLVELIISMTITLVVLAIASTALTRALNIRTRANQNVDSLADAERALNIMSREISQAGFNLMSGDNGIVPQDSVTDANGNSTIRIRANLNKFNTSVSSWARNGIGDPNAAPGEDEGEDVKYSIYPAAETTLLARYDRYRVGDQSTVLANRLDQLHIHYFAQRVTYAQNPDSCDVTGFSTAELPSPVGAKYVVIAICVQQDQTGVAGGPGYQRAQRVLLTSDVALRNANLLNY